jgi:hypothetical protein
MLVDYVPVGLYLELFLQKELQFPDRTRPVDIV